VTSGDEPPPHLPNEIDRTSPNTIKRKNESNQLTQFLLITEQGKVVFLFFKDLYSDSNERIQTF
jgi:hypothetical protein